MKILYTSLFPKNPIQHEYENLDFFIKSSEFYGIYDQFDFRFFSAHNEPLDFLKKRCGLKYTYGKVDFQYDERMNERRGHEISFCKSKILDYNISMADKYDYLFFIDSDIRIDSNEIYQLCKILEFRENTFVNIPYALRDMKCISNASFGCYIIPSSILKQNKDLWKVIYNIQEIDDQICRIGAPDCNIRNTLITRGYSELMALSACTRHYIDNTHYIEYDEGKIKVFE